MTPKLVQAPRNVSYSNTFCVSKHSPPTIEHVRLGALLGLWDLEQRPKTKAGREIPDRRFTE